MGQTSERVVQPSVRDRADRRSSPNSAGVSAADCWNGQPNDPAQGGWYWLARRVGADLRHTAWYWCDECRQWEAEPNLAFSADHVAAEGWRILSSTIPPQMTPQQEDC